MRYSDSSLFFFLKCNRQYFKKRKSAKWIWKKEASWENPIYVFILGLCIWPYSIVTLQGDGSSRYSVKSPLKICTQLSFSLLFSDVFWNVIRARVNPRMLRMASFFTPKTKSCRVCLMHTKQQNNKIFRGIFYNLQTHQKYRKSCKVKECFLFSETLKYRVGEA